MCHLHADLGVNELTPTDDQAVSHCVPNVI